MATLTPPPTSSLKSNDESRFANGRSASAGGSADELIAVRIAEAQLALWRAELIQSVLMLLVSGIIFVTAWAMLEQWLWAPGRFIRCIVWLAAISAVIAWIRGRIWPLFSKQVRPEYAAYSLEHDAPSLRHSLTSYVTLREDQAAAGVRGLVVRSIGARAAGQLRQLQLESPSEAAVRMGWWLALAVAIAFAAAYVAYSPRSVMQSTQRLLMPIASIEAPRRVSIFDVQPGDTQTLASLPFLVSAKIDGLRESDTAVVQWGMNFSQTQPLDWDASTGRYQGHVQVDTSTSYRVMAGDAVAGPYSITANSLPVATVEQIDVVPPTYTELPARTTRGGPIVAEANSQVRVTGVSTLPIRKARLEFNPVTVGDRVQATGGVVDLKIGADGKQFSAEFVLADLETLGAPKRTAYRVHVWDEKDLENPDPIVYPIRMVEDLLPEISIASPKQTEVELPINGSLPIEIHAADPDYRLKQIDVQIKRGIDVVWAEPVWSSALGERGHQSVVWIFAPESVKANVGDRFELAALALDNHHDASGKLASGKTTTGSLFIKIVKADPAGRVGPQGKPEEQGAEGGRAGAPGKTGEEPTGTGEGQPNGASAAGGSGENASSKEQGGGEGGASGESGQESGDESGSSEGNGEGQGTPGGQSKAGTSQSKSGSQASGNESQTSDNASNDSMNPSEPDHTEQSGSDEGESSKASAQGGGKPNTAPEKMTVNNADTSEGQGEAGETPAGQPGQQANGDQSLQSGTGNPNDQNLQTPDRPQKPSHDGEAFERIREFIQNQQPQGNSGSGSEAQAPRPNQGEKGQNSGTAKSAQPEDQPGGGKAERQQPGTENPSTQAEQGNKDSGAAEQSSGPQNAGQEPSSANADGSQSGTEEQPGSDDSNQGEGSDKNDSMGQSGATEEQSGATKEQGGATEEQGRAANDTGSQNADAGDADANGEPSQSGQPDSGGDSKHPASSQSGSDQDQSASSNSASSNSASSNSASGNQAETGNPNGDSHSEEEPAGKGGQNKQGDQGESAGQPGSDSQGTGQPKPNRQNAEDLSQPGQQPKDGDTKNGDAKNGEAKADQANDGQPNDDPSNDAAASESQPSDGNLDGGSQSPAGKSASGNSDQANSNSNADPESGNASSMGAPGENRSSDQTDRSDREAAGAGEGGDEVRPPDPVNAEYAREATDLVLKYLNSHRDALPPELLERLDWTPEELRDFADRWSRLRNQEATGTADRKMIDESLRSLGLRKPTSDSIGRSTERADQLQGLKDAGNRNDAPAVHRDAFDAFRRNFGRQ